MLHVATTDKDRRGHYPEIEPLRTGRLRVSDLHEIYFEECGNRDGKPAVHLHGGPGVGSQPTHRRNFDPEAYRIILFDQRGAGKSTPHAELRENTTWDLVEDMEQLRRHLDIDRWQVFGGSWGSTLALAYAQTHPDRVSELVLRGIFLARQAEIQWLYQAGPGAVFPDAFEEFLKPIPQAEHDDLLGAYHRRLTGEDRQVQVEAARAWTKWEASTLALYPNLELVARYDDDDLAIALARIECHYFVGKCFLESETQLLDNLDAIRHIPAVIVQGRYDMVTPMMSAWDLHRAWPEADFQLIPDAGHAATEPGIVDALVRATDRFRE